jgi:hypothetical protein
LEDFGGYGKILELILGNYGEKLWTELIWLRIGTSDVLCEHGDEPSGFIRGGDDFLTS